MGHREAVVESVRTRIRPIFMTTLIGFFGLLPLVISPGAGSELYRGLGSVLLGGLLVSTVFTLFLVPSLFSLALEIRDSVATRVTFLRPTERHDHTPCSRTMSGSPNCNRRPPTARSGGFLPPCVCGLRPWMTSRLRNLNRSNEPRSRSAARCSSVSIRAGPAFGIAAGGTTGSWPGPCRTSRSRCRCSASSTCCRCCATSEAIAAHLHEYFDEVRSTCPRRRGWAWPSPRRTRLAGRALAIAARRNAMAHARRFIAGTDSREVLAAAHARAPAAAGLHARHAGRGRDQRSRGRALSAGVSRPDRRHRADGQHLARGAADRSRPQRTELPRVNVSVKLSALDSQFDPIDPDGTTAPRRGAAAAAAAAGAASTGRSSTSTWSRTAPRILTLAIFQQRADGGRVPRTSPTWASSSSAICDDSGDDLIALRDWARARGTPVWVRLVKGAYWDYETVHAQATGWPVPVFKQKWETDANFERLTRFVLRNHQWLRPALGSHNLRSLAHGIAVAEHLGLPPTAFELQMLYGMADAEKQALVELGHRLRIYMPYGELIPGMAYLVRRLLENTSNDSFLRASFAEHVSPESC